MRITALAERSFNVVRSGEVARSSEMLARGGLAECGAGSIVLRNVVDIERMSDDCRGRDLPQPLTIPRGRPCADSRQECNQMCAQHVQTGLWSSHQFGHI